MITRWFHDGCCECIAHTCINYGINESRCLQCPGEESDNPVETDTFTGEDYENGEGDDGKKGSKVEEKLVEKEKQVTPLVV